MADDVTLPSAGHCLVGLLMLYNIVPVVSFDTIGFDFSPLPIHTLFLRCLWYYGFESVEYVGHLLEEVQVVHLLL